MVLMAAARRAAFALWVLVAAGDPARGREQPLARWSRLVDMMGAPAAESSARPGRGPPAPRHAAVSVDWTSPAGVGISRTLTTLQVVNNPVLDRVFTAPNGTTFPNPIHAAVWGSLKNLSETGMSMARFVPWYPYPKKAVAELYRPKPGKPPAWNFSLLMPQLEDFFAATADVQDADTVINFSTEPCWMFNTNASQCAPPANPDQADMTYGSKGGASFRSGPSGLGTSCLSASEGQPAAANAMLLPVHTHCYREAARPEL